MQKSRRNRQFADIRDSLKSSQVSIKPLLNLNSVNTPSQSSHQNFNQIYTPKVKSRIREYDSQLQKSKIFKQDKPVEKLNPEVQKKLKQVCFNCVNKIIANKKKLEQLQKKERQQKIQKQKLQQERQQILKEQMANLKKIKQLQRINKDQIQSKQKQKQIEMAEKKSYLKKIQQQQIEAYQQQKKIMQQEKNRSINHINQLKKQMEDKKISKIKQIEEQNIKKMQNQALFDEKEIQNANKLKQINYRADLVNQISQKIRKQMESRQNEIQRDKEFLKAHQKIIDQQKIPLPQYRYSELAKQIKQKQKQAKQENQKFRQQQKIERQQRMKQQDEKKKIVNEQKFNQMKKYIEDLSNQMKQIRDKKKKEKEEKQTAWFSEPKEQIIPEVKNCEECDKKYPINYFSQIQDI